MDLSLGKLLYKRIDWRELQVTVQIAKYKLDECKTPHFGQHIQMESQYNDF